MIIHPAPAELNYFALRVLTRPGPNEWLALVAATAEVEKVGGELAESLRAIGDVEPALISVSTATEFIYSVYKHQKGALVLLGVDKFTVDDWRTLDADRSLLQREDASVLVLGEEALGKLFRHAPNFASWLGGQTRLLKEEDHSLTPEERESHLAPLREWSGMTDEEVIARAERGELAPDPRYAIWLVLLHRGDLLG